jgi:hypothetical protein
MHFNQFLSLDELIHEALYLGIIPGEFIDNMYTIYEWEYKYHKIKASQKTNPKRKYNLMAAIEKDLIPICRSVLQDLDNVYVDWLEDHAILSPRTWAEKRVEKSDGDEYGNMVYEYKEYLPYDNIVSDFIQINWEYFVPWVQEDRDFRIENIRSDLENITDEDERQVLENEISELENMEITENEVTNYMSDIYSSLDEFRDSITTSMIIDFYEKIIFPAWYNNWSWHGIDEVRQRNEELEQEIQTVSNSNNLSSMFVVINKALNGIHVTGPMTDYMDNLDFSQRDINILSNMDVSQWDKELTEIGVW